MPHAAFVDVEGEAAVEQRTPLRSRLEELVDFGTVAADDGSFPFESGEHRIQILRSRSLGQPRFSSHALPDCLCQWLHGLYAAVITAR